MDLHTALDTSADPSAKWGSPVVFGNPQRPLVGRLHPAVGPARGAVVLFNPLGYEENCAFRTFQLLAGELAARGFDTLRFDYDGTGNSWGDGTDPDRLAAWVDSCGAAIDFQASRTGGPVHVVGLRLGAALALLASSRRALDRVVLWDPVVNGRRYLRTLRAMSMMGINAAPDPRDPDSLVVIGHYLSAPTVRSLEQLDLAVQDQTRIGSALVIGRPHTADPSRMLAALSARGIVATAEDLAGTAELMDGAAEQSVIPRAIVARILEFLTAGPAVPATTTPREALPASASFSAPASPGWTEQYFALGPRGLAAVLTLPATLRRQGAVVMANNGVARNIGPARAWVEWARVWAALGIASIRFDISGVGDSAPQPAQQEDTVYPVESIDDFAAVTAELRRHGLEPGVAVGLCSGAFLSLDAAAAAGELAGVVAINPQLFYLPDPPYSANRLRRAAPPTHPWVQRFLENTRVGRRLVRELPYPAWRLLDLVGLAPSPIHGANAAAARTRVLMIFGDDNIGLKYLRRRTTNKALREWEASGRMVVIDGLDHSMFAPRIREAVELRTRQFLSEVLTETAQRPAP